MKLKSFTLKMHMCFFILLLSVVPHFDCSIFPRVSLFLVSAKFRLPTAKNGTGEFSPSQTFVNYFVLLNEISLTQWVIVAISLKYHFQAMRNIGHTSREQSTQSGEVRLHCYRCWAEYWENQISLQTVCLLRRRSEEIESSLWSIYGTLSSINQIIK